MNCPYCNKVIIVKLVKDDGKTEPVKANGSDISDLGELLDMIEDGALEGGAVEFVAQTRERYEKYGDKTRMSEKQMAWLRKLADPKAEEEWS